MSVVIPPGTYRLTAKSTPVAPGRYLGWTCSECSQSIEVFDAPAGGVTFDPPAPSPVLAHIHALVKCPHCAAERLYLFMELKPLHVESAR